MNVSDHKGVQALLGHLGITLDPARFDVRYNVAPGMLLLGVQEHDGPQLAAFEWGIVPPWAKPEQFSRPLINARAETIWDKPSFRNLVRRYRAVIPANGFYEWRRRGEHKQAFHITHQHVSGHQRRQRHHGADPRPHARDPGARCDGRVAARLRSHATR
jgi:putative SOS response-associated peptidase YedK